MNQYSGIISYPSRLVTISYPNRTITQSTHVLEKGALNTVILNRLIRERAEILKNKNKSLPLGAAKIAQWLRALLFLQRT